MLKSQSLNNKICLTLSLKHSRLESQSLKVIIIIRTLKSLSLNNNKISLKVKK
jgi:hypothetical protein